jgi:hypothetical protein
MSTMDTLKSVYQDYHFCLSRPNLAIGRAWRLQDWNQSKDTIPSERGIIEPWAGETT